MAPLRSKSGRVLTDETVDKLARRLEEGYEPGQLRPRKVGRPPLGDEHPDRRYARNAIEIPRVGAWESDLVRRALSPSRQSCRLITSGDEAVRNGFQNVVFFGPS